MDALENLNAWKRACKLAARLYRVTAGCRDRGFRDQITRAALSVPSNIAEGYERGTGRYRLQHLRIAKGSCGELWTQLQIGRMAGLIDPETATGLEAETREISKMIFGLIKYYETRQG